MIKYIFMVTTIATGPGNYAPQIDRQIHEVPSYEVCNQLRRDATPRAQNVSEYKSREVTKSGEQVITVTATCTKAGKD